MLSARAREAATLLGSRWLLPHGLLGLNAVFAAIWLWGGPVESWRDSVEPLAEWVSLALTITALGWLVAQENRLRSDRAETARISRTLSAVAGSRDDVWWEATLDGVFTYVSAAASRTLGYRPEELVGRHLDSILAERERPRATELFQSSALTRVGWQNEFYICLSKCGREVPLLGSGVAHLDAQGKLQGFTGVLLEAESASASHRERDATRDRITDVLQRRALQIVFQPIFDNQSGCVVGAEALARFPAQPRRPPDQWFADAARVNLAIELELLAVEEALNEARRLPSGVYLSVNVSPTTLITGRLTALLASSDWDCHRLVVEITEHATIDNYDALQPAMAALRHRGIRLAVDDAGAGYASFQHILRLRPDYIKLDRGLVSGIDADPAMRALVRALAAFAREMNADLIAEGIETEAERQCTADLGLRYAQGYLLGRPSPAVASWGNGRTSGPTDSLQLPPPRGVSQ